MSHNNFSYYAKYDYSALQNGMHTLALLDGQNVHKTQSTSLDIIGGISSKQITSSSFVHRNKKKWLNKNAGQESKEREENISLIH